MSMRRARRTLTAPARNPRASVAARVGALALLLAACTASPPAIAPTAVPTHEPGALDVTALLDLSGTRAPSGVPQRDALQLWLDQQGTRTPRVRLRVVDVGGSDARTLLELKRAATDERADAVIVGVPLTYDDVLARVVDIAALPVLFTLPLADPAASGGRWAFALAPTPAQLARAAAEDARARTVLAPSLIVSDESTAAVAERVALQAELAMRGVAVPLAKVGAADAAQRLAGPLTAARSVFFAGAVPGYAAAARQATGSPSLPLLYFSYLADQGALADLRDAASLATWPGTRAIAATGGDGAAARAAFLRAYQDRHGPPSSHAASAYDALTLLAAAAADRGTDAAALRDRLESAAATGLATTYAFSATRHAGFASDDLVLVF